MAHRLQYPTRPTKPSARPRRTSQTLWRKISRPNLERGNARRWQSMCLFFVQEVEKPYSSSEAVLKFVTTLNNIIRGQDLYTDPQKFGITRNLITGEALWVFEQKSWERGSGKNENYELMMKDFICYFFPPKALQRQKRCIKPATQILHTSYVGSMIWSSNSRSFLPLGRDNAYQKTIPSIW